MCSVHRMQVASTQKWCIKNSIAGAILYLLCIRVGFSELSQLTPDQPLGLRLGAQRSNPGVRPKGIIRQRERHLPLEEALCFMAAGRYVWSEHAYCEHPKGFHPCSA